MSDDRAALVAEYEAVTGKAIFNGWSDEEIRSRIDKSKAAIADLDGAEPAYQQRKVKVRVLPLGAGKIHTGRNPSECAQRGDELTVEPAIGEALEKRGFAEVLGDG